MDQYCKDRVYTERASKVPEVTLGFWLIKILATTLGETGGDAVTMSMNLGYLLGTAIFAAIFAIAVAGQISAKRFHPFLYWMVIVATTTVGTTLADFVDRSLGIGYLGGFSLLAALLIASLVTWHRTLGTVSIDSINSKRDADVMVLQFSAPFSNPFSRRQLGVVARVSLGDESPMWYWIPIGQRNGTWAAGSPVILSVRE